MSRQLQDAIFETTTTQGTGTVNLAGAVTGYNAFSDKFSNGDALLYVIEQQLTDVDGNVTGIDREVGLGTLTTGSPDTLSRDVVFSSSNSDAAVNFGSGTKDVFCAPASAFVRHQVRSVTAAETLTKNDHGLTLLCDGSGGAFTVDLPAGSTVFDGWAVTLKKSDASSNAITADGNGAETLDGATTRALLEQYEAETYVWTGSEWSVIAAGNLVDKPLVDGWISGLVVSNNGTDAEHDLDIAIGVARWASGDGSTRLSTALTKRMDAAFAAGTNAGGLGDTVSLPTSGTLHVWLATKDTDGSVDVFGDTSVAGANAPTGYTARRRIGSVVTDASANIVAVSVRERAGGAVEVLVDDPILDIDDSATGTSANTAAISVPAGIQVEADGTVQIADNTTAIIGYISSPDVNDEAPSSSAGPLGNAGGAAATTTQVTYYSQHRVRTDTSSQLRYRTSGDGTFRWATTGWLDDRRP